MKEIHLPACIDEALEQKYDRARAARVIPPSFDDMMPPRCAELLLDPGDLLAHTCPVNRMPAMPLIERGEKKDADPVQRTIVDLSWVRYETIPTPLLQASVDAPTECITTLDGITYHVRSIYGYKLGSTRDRRIAAVLVRLDVLDSSTSASMRLHHILKGGGRVFRPWWDRVCATLV